MKKIFTFLAALLFVTIIVGQVPHKMSYQAVIRDSSNELVKNTVIGMRISILQGSADGTQVYTETQTPQTNSNGLVSTEIGGQPGFDEIDWAAASFFIMIETDPQGGSNYSVTGVTPILQVPYAIYAQSAHTADYNNLENLPELFDGQYSSLTDAPQVPTDVSDLTDDNNLLPFQGTANGEMMFWNGSEWDVIAAGQTGQVLAFAEGSPTWVSPADLAFALTLSASPIEGGTSTGAGQYQAGTELTIVAVPAEDFVFVNWVSAIGVVSEQAELLFTMPAENTNLTAVFEPEGGSNADGDPGDGVTDIDGNTYNSIHIGQQEWMAENLKTTKYSNGNPIDYPGTNNSGWANNTTGAYAWYQNAEANKEIYGALYNWYAVNTGNLCPAGWKVPTNDDWNQLVNYLVLKYGYSEETNDVNGVGNSLKSCRQVDSSHGGECNTTEIPRWNANAIHAGNDVFGFAGLPAGSRNYITGSYSNAGSFGDFWSSTEDTASNAFRRNMSSGHAGFLAHPTSKSTGYSVRCVKVTDK